MSSILNALATEIVDISTVFTFVGAQSQRLLLIYVKKHGFEESIIDCVINFQTLICMNLVKIIRHTPITFRK